MHQLSVFWKSNTLAGPRKREVYHDEDPALDGARRTGKR